MLTTLNRRLVLLLACALLIAACGSDGDADDEPTDDATTTTTVDVDDATTAAPTTTAAIDDTTTDVAEAPAGVVAEGTVTTAEGLTADWTLTATDTSLCFEAVLNHDDPDAAASAGAGVAECLEPDAGLDEMETGLSVDVGTADGEKSIGYLWGRVSPAVTTLTIQHSDGTQTPVDILEGPTEVGLFAFVVDVSTIPPVLDLDASSDTQLEGSEPIRDFLRAGPTYPVATSTTSTTSPDYPVG